MRTLLMIGIAITLMLSFTRCKTETKDSQSSVKAIDTTRLQRDDSQTDAVSEYEMNKIQIGMTLGEFRKICQCYPEAVTIDTSTFNYLPGNQSDYESNALSEVSSNPYKPGTVFLVFEKPVTIEAIITERLSAFKTVDHKIDTLNPRVKLLKWKVIP